MSVSSSLLLEKNLNEKGFSSVAGVDEAGRGPLAGPVVAAACILPLDFDVLGIEDSKTLTAAKRRSLYHFLNTASEVAIGVGIVEPLRIDEINILQASLEAMQKAVAALDAAPDYVLVDGKQTFSTFCPAEAIVKGDQKSTSVAAASIVAKHLRDEMMLQYHEKYQGYDFAKNKGYGTRSHLEALARLGPSPIHRKSFSPIKEMGEKP